jgi:hypothetical protein
MLVNCACAGLASSSAASAIDGTDAIDAEEAIDEAADADEAVSRAMEAGCFRLRKWSAFPPRASG